MTAGPSNPMSSSSDAAPPRDATGGGGKRGSEPTLHPVPPLPSATIRANKNQVGPPPPRQFFPPSANSQRGTSPAAAPRGFGPGPRPPQGTSSRAGHCGPPCPPGHDFSCGPAQPYRHHHSTTPAELGPSARAFQGKQYQSNDLARGLIAPPSGGYCTALLQQQREHCKSLDSSTTRKNKAAAAQVDPKLSAPPKIFNNTKSAKLAVGPVPHATTTAGNKKRNPPPDAPKKPCRPLNAYNLFFKHERTRVILLHREGKSIDDYPLTPADLTLDRVRALLENNLFHTNRKKRRHRKMHGAVSFKKMTEIVSQSWRKLDAAGRGPFLTVAAEHKERHTRAIGAWNDAMMKEKRAKREAAATPASAASAKVMAKAKAKAWHVAMTQNQPRKGGTTAATPSASTFSQLSVSATHQKVSPELKDERERPPHQHAHRTKMSANDTVVIRSQSQFSRDGGPAAGAPCKSRELQLQRSQVGRCAMPQPAAFLQSSSCTRNPRCFFSGAQSELGLIRSTESLPQHPPPHGKRSSVARVVNSYSPLGDVVETLVDQGPQLQPSRSQATGCTMPQATSFPNPLLRSSHPHRLHAGIQSEEEPTGKIPTAEDCERQSTLCEYELRMSHFHKVQHLQLERQVRLWGQRLSESRVSVSAEVEEEIEKLKRLVNVAMAMSREHMDRYDRAQEDMTRMVERARNAPYPPVSRPAEDEHRPLPPPPFQTCPRGPFETEPPQRFSRTQEITAHPHLQHIPPTQEVRSMKRKQPEQGRDSSLRLGAAVPSSSSKYPRMTGPPSSAYINAQPQHCSSSSHGPPAAAEGAVEKSSERAGLDALLLLSGQGTSPPMTTGRPSSSSAETITSAGIDGPPAA